MTAMICFHLELTGSICTYGVFSRAQGRPVLKFAYIVETTGFVSVRVNGSVVFRVAYINSIPKNSQTLGCEIGNGTDLSNGILNLQLDPVTSFNAGVYELLFVDTRKACRTLYVLGMSNISIISLWPSLRLQYSHLKDKF